LKPFSPNSTSVFVEKQQKKVQQAINSRTTNFYAGQKKYLDSWFWAAFIGCLEMK
jgi:hypothetical protein